MNQNLTDITFILDRSGSMESLRRAAINGFNEFLHIQQNAPGQALLSLIQFDDQYEVWARALPIAEVTPLTKKTFQPRGCTALLDALGRTIDETGERLAALPEPQRLGKVIIAVMTDGLENASTRFNHREVAQRIAHQRDVYSWEFLFLGANQDAIATAAQLNILKNNAVTYGATPVACAAVTSALSRKVSAIRSAQAGDPQPGPDLAAPMSQILREELNKKNRDDTST
ncbi:MAG: VWA domain-containing protein [Candidatus Methylacidiphilales bacterium]